MDSNYTEDSCLPFFSALYHNFLETAHWPIFYQSCLIVVCQQDKKTYQNQPPAFKDTFVSTLHWLIALASGIQVKGIDEFIIRHERDGNNWKSNYSNEFSLCLLHHIVSWEPEGRYCRWKMFRWEPEGRYCHWLCTAIAPFWFSMEHLWAAITPFWLSTDDMWILAVMWEFRF